MIDALLGKFYKYIIIALIVVIAAQLLYANHLAGKLNKADAVRIKSVADAIKPYQDAIDQAQIEKATIMKTWSDKYIEVEQNAIKKYKMQMLPLVVLIWLLAGCQSNSMKPTNVCPQLPIKPSLSTPLPTASYSKLAQQNIEAWQKKQMATQLMSND